MMVLLDWSERWLARKKLASWDRIIGHGWLLCGAFETLREERGLRFLFVANDLAVATRFCDRIAVLYRGRRCDFGTTEQIIRRPAHRETAALLAADPELMNTFDTAHAPGARR